MSAPELAELQRWFLATITQPGREASELARHVADDPGLSPAERVEIYAAGYYLRLRECLRADYPVLRSLLGDELFDRFAREYLEAQPPRTYTLFELGAGFAEHLERTRPPLDGLSASERATMQLPVELARLERAWVLVLRSRGEEGADYDSLDHLPLGPLGGLALRPASNLELVATSTPLVEFHAARRAGLEPEIPSPAPGHLAVSRRDYRVHVTALEPWQRALIIALRQHPNLDEALDRAATASTRERAELAAAVIYWLPRAITRGLFAPV